MAESGNDGAVAETGDNSTSGTVEGTNQDQNGQAGGEQAQAAQRPGFWGIAKTLVVRGFIIYMISSFFRRSSTPQQTETNPAGKTIQPATNLFPKNLMMDMYVYINEEETFTEFDKKSNLFWLEEELQYGDWSSGINADGIFTWQGPVPVSTNVQNNGSLYLHIFFVKAGMSPDPSDEHNYRKQFTLSRSKRLNKFKKRRYHTTVNLLTGKTDVHPDLVRKPNETTVEVLSHWHPNLTINIIDDHTPWMSGSIPAPLDEYIHIDHSLNKYYPIVYFNEYWNLNSDYMPINTTTPVLNLSLTYQPLSLFRWQMYAAQGMRSRWYSFMGDDFMEESDEDQDSLKQALVETNPYLLGITIIVSIVHSVFEFLAFKNDIQFWRNRKSLEGLSVRSVFFNVFQSLIVVLYVMDNETNFVVRVSVVIGLAIEVWKIFKVVDVKLDRENLLFGVFPRVQLADKSTYTESQTKQYDMLAFKYLSWLLFPLLGCYAVYSVLYVEHRGWYSWVLSLLYGFLLTFGFIMMTPQLFINYKLKSVAHLPWRMLTYKALNTFIDDLFAFVIKMPTLYRLGCFRDDIIFLIYVYQRWIYRVDPKRVNEFGTSQEMFEQNGVIGTAGDGDLAIEGTSATSQEGEKQSDSLPEPTTSDPKPVQAKKDD